MSGFLDFLSDPSVLNIIGTGIQVAGKLQTASDQKDYGADSKAAAQFQADQLRDRAGASVASAQRAAFIEDRRAKLAMSSALASAAASGGGASDPTVIHVIAGIAEEGAYRRAVALYEGTDRARVLQMQARAKEIEGGSRQDSADSAATGSYIQAATSLVPAAARGRDIAQRTGSDSSFLGSQKDASLYQRFGGDGPKVGTAGGGADSWWTYDGMNAY